MSQSVRRALLACALVGAVVSGAAAQGRHGGEKHPVLQNSVQQLERIKDHLQNAPTDFGGHKASAIGAINNAINELNQAIAFDKK